MQCAIDIWKCCDIIHFNQTGKVGIRVTHAEQRLQTASLHDAMRAMSLSGAIFNAARFSFALRFYFFGIYPPSVCLERAL